MNFLFLNCSSIFSHLNSAKSQYKRNSRGSKCNINKRKFSKYSNSKNLTEQIIDYDNKSLTNSSSSPLINGASITAPTFVNHNQTAINHNLVSPIQMTPSTSAVSTSLASSFISNTNFDSQYKSSVFSFGNSINDALNGNLNNPANGCSTTSSTNSFLYNNISSHNNYNRQNLNNMPVRYTPTNASSFQNSALNNFNYSQYNLLNTNVHSGHHSNNNLLLPFFNPSSVEEEKPNKIKAEN